MPILNRHVEYFLQVAHCRTLREASAKVRIAQPALSVAFNSLEEELGFKLFERSRNGITLTEKGRALHQMLTAMNSKIRSEISVIRDQSYIQPIKFGCIEHFANKYLLDSLPKKKNFPEIQLFMMRSISIYDEVLRKSLDFGIVAWTKEPKRLASILIKPEAIAIAGLKSKFAYIEKIKNVEDLKDETWVKTPKPQEDWPNILEEGKQGFVAGGFFSQVKAILAGAGIGECQLDAFTDYELSKLAICPAPTFHKATGIYLVYRQDLAPNKRETMAQVLQLCRDRLTAR